MKLLCCSRVWSFGDFKTLGALPESILSSPLLSYKSQNSILLILSWKWKWSHSVLSNSLQPHGLSPTRLLHPWDFPGKNTGVGCHFLLQGSFLIQGSNPGLPHCRQMLYHLSHQGSQINSASTHKKVYHQYKVPLLPQIPFVQVNHIYVSVTLKKSI